MKAAVLKRIGEPLAIRNLDIPELEAGQVLVKVLCAGICGSQLQEIDGIKGDPNHCPHLLGHEGCGIVELTGLGVTTVRQGDKVVMHWRKGAGMDASGGVYGSVTSGPITTFSEYSIAAENRVTRIDDDVPNDFAALLGCCLSTALAIIENEAQPLFRASAVRVVGCGGLGLAIIFVLASKLMDYRPQGMDLKDKRELVESLGGRFVRRNFYCDLLIDTVGTSEQNRRKISLQSGGTSGGGFEPNRDIPRYVQMWRDGELNDYTKLITHRIALEEINDGIRLMREGKAGRVMIEFL